MILTKPSKALFFLGISIFVCGLVQADTFNFLRDGRILVRGGSNEIVTVEYEAVYEADKRSDFIYLQSPTGLLMECTEIFPGQMSGSFQYTLDQGPGDYAITVAGPTYRRYTVSVPAGVPVVFEPPRFFINCFVSPLMDQLYFRVPEGTSEFSIHCRRDQTPSLLDTMELYTPSGTKMADLALPQPGMSAYFPFSSLTIPSPEEGFWRISFSKATLPCKAAFWVNGIPTRFCRDPAQWFEPKKKPGKVKISVGSHLGPAGKIGGCLGGNPIPQVLDNVEYMGLESNNYYIGHDYREPVNDNADPFQINWPAFNWNDDLRIQVMTGPPYNLELSQIIQPASWLDHPITQQIQMDELAELFEVYLIHHNVVNQIGMKYFTPLDEPNLKGYELADYEGVVESFYNRIASSTYPEIKEVKLLVPGSSQFSEPTNGTTQSGLEWAEYLYEYHDEKVDGIVFHLWWCRNLLSLHLFRREVLLACQVMEEFDRDGNKEELIIVDQTNMMPGPSSSPYDVNSFRASLWWAGVICNTLGTGRVTAVNWFTTVDDNFHKKGFMYDASKNYALKPVGYATRFLTTHRLSEILEVETSHPEVDALASFEPSGDQLSLLVVNKGKRWIEAEISLSDLDGVAPPSPREKPGDDPLGGFSRLEIFRLQAGDLEAKKNPVPGKGPPGKAPSCLKVPYLIAPETIYAFRFVL